MLYTFSLYLLSMNSDQLQTPNILRRIAITNYQFNSPTISIPLINRRYLSDILTLWYVWKYESIVNDRHNCCKTINYIAKIYFLYFNLLINTLWKVWLILKVLMSSSQWSTAQRNINSLLGLIWREMLTKNLSSSP